MEPKPKPMRKVDRVSKPMRGTLRKELLHVPAKRGSVSGRQHPDVTYVRILFEPEAGNLTLEVNCWGFEDDYPAARAKYEGLRI